MLDGLPTAPGVVASLLTGESTPHDFTRAIGAAASTPCGSSTELDLGARGTADAELLLRHDPLQWPATARRWAVVDGRAVLASAPSAARSGCGTSPRAP